MRSTSRHDQTRRRAALFRLACSSAFALVMTACAAGPSNVQTEAPLVRLKVPAWARQPCTVTTALEPTLAGLETRDRARGVDVAECSGKHQLTLQVIDLEHELQDQQLAQRESRNRSWWSRLTPWRED